MKRLWMGILLAMCCALLLGGASAMAEDSFSVALLRDYAQDQSSAAYYEEGSGADLYWSYDYEGLLLPLPVDNGSVSGLGGIYLGMLGFGQDNVGMPFLSMYFNTTADLDFNRLDLQVADSVYNISLKKNTLEVTESGGSYTYTVSLVLGSVGLPFLQDLNEASYKMTARLYYSKTEYLEIAQTAQNDFGAYFQGLIEAHYFDDDGNVQASIKRLLEKGVDKNKDLPQFTRHEKNDASWPAPTATPEPAATPLALIEDGEIGKYQTWNVGDKDPQILEIRDAMYELGYFRNKPDQKDFTTGMVEYLNEFQRANGLPVTQVISPEDQAVLFSGHAVPKATPTPKPENAPKLTATPKPTATPYAEPDIPVEMTSYADWGRNKGEPWFKIEVRNTSQSRTVQSVTLIYLCKDASKEPLKAADGSTYQSVVVDKKIGTGRKVDLPRVTVSGFENVKTIEVAIGGIQFDDGTSITIEVRDLLFWNFEYK